MNPFLLPLDEYNRNLDVRQGYIEQTAKYISLQLKKPLAECLDYVKKETRRGGKFEFKDPQMLQLVRKGPGHREPEETTFLGYVNEVIDTNRILSPSMVIYERPEVEKSVTAEWQDDNIAARKRSKKRMFVLKQEGDVLGSQLADYDQNARKIRINSVSGMRGFEGNPLFIATGHSSLTSLCRAAAGYGNATVERFLAGSRHYHTPEIAKANIVAVCTIEKRAAFADVIDKYGINYPTVDQVCKMIARSTDLYWSDETENAIIRSAVEGMTALERAIFCYSGDMYHLAQYNDQVIRDMLTTLIAIDISDVPDVVTDDVIKGMDPTDLAYVNALCATILRGSTYDRVKANDPAGWQTIGKVAWKVQQGLNHYADFITMFFATSHLPPTVASLKSIQRRVCLAADTDSSIFTCEGWVEWYSGNLMRGEEQDRIWYLATYMVCQCIAHSLAKLSTNIGVEKSQTFRLAMKNEYAFPQFALTNLAKHYYSTMSMREGNVYKELEMETKGVELRGSTSQKHILKATADLMESTLHAVNEGKKLNAGEVLLKVANSELDCVRSILRGEYTFLKSDNIKPDSKKMPYHELWQDVFGPKYGKMTEPPYACVKLSLDLGNQTALKAWLADLEDREFAERMALWCSRYNRKDLNTILLPTQAIRQCGLPIEIQQAANIRKLAYQINSGFYRILESMGLFIVDRNNLRLVYDFLGLEP